MYSVFTFFQEFISRGVLQSVLMKFAETSYEKIRAIIIVTLVFTAGHFHLPTLYFALMVIIPSLFWSCLFEKLGRRVVGVVFSHSLIGVLFFTVIGFQGILHI